MVLTHNLQFQQAIGTEETQSAYIFYKPTVYTEIILCLDISLKQLGHSQLQICINNRFYTLDSSYGSGLVQSIMKI